MAEYRVYCLDGVNRFVRADWVQAKTDEEALAAARTVMGDSPRCEVWRGERMVGRIGPQDASD